MPSTPTIPTSPPWKPSRVQVSRSKSFKTNRHEELIAVCNEDAIDAGVFGAWYGDWQTKRFAVERRFLPLIEFALAGNLLAEDDKPSMLKRF